MALILSFLLAFCLMPAVFAYTPEALADQITNLPGAENLKITFNQFSGYLDIPGVNAGDKKHMHYW